MDSDVVEEETIVGVNDGVAGVVASSQAHDNVGALQPHFEVRRRAISSAVRHSAFCHANFRASFGAEISSVKSS